MNARRTFCLREEKRRTDRDISRIGKHNARTVIPDNADPGRIRENRRLFDAAPEHDDFWEKTKAVYTSHGIDPEKIRSNGVRAIEGIFTLSHELTNELPDVELETIFAHAVGWLSKRYAGDLVVVDLHMDEQGAHIHYLYIPRVGKRLCARKRISRRKLFQLQREAGNEFVKVGLERPIHGSKARHVDIARSHALFTAPLPDFEVLPSDFPDLPLIRTAASQEDYKLRAADQLLRQLRNRGLDNILTSASRAKDSAQKEKEYQRTAASLSNEVDRLCIELNLEAAKRASVEHAFEAYRREMDELHEELHDTIAPIELCQSVGFSIDRDSEGARVWQQSGEELLIGEHRVVALKAGRVFTGSIGILRVLMPHWTAEQCFRHLVMRFGEVRARAAIREYGRTIAKEKNADDLPLPRALGKQMQHLVDALAQQTASTAARVRELQSLGGFYVGRFDEAVFPYQDPQHRAVGYFSHLEKSGRVIEQDFANSTEAAFVIGPKNGTQREVVFGRSPLDLLQTDAHAPQRDSIGYISSGPNRLPWHWIETAARGGLPISFVGFDRSKDKWAELVAGMRSRGLGAPIRFADRAKHQRELPPHGGKGTEGPYDRD